LPDRQIWSILVVSEEKGGSMWPMALVVLPVPVWTD
jgi:hypothetical protein